MTFLDEIHPERRIDGFTNLSGTLTFYAFVRAIMLKHNAKKVLDFGAGRGEFYEAGGALNLHLRDLRFNGAHVCACDVDPVVLSHPCSQEQIVLPQGDRLPFADATFDIIVSDMTFEHIDEPLVVASELVRVLKPGGYICARTPNKYGYVAMVSRLLPNSWHVRLLQKIQPNRDVRDVFPTRYHMNTRGALEKLFQPCDVCVVTMSGEPAYFFGSATLYRLLLIFHKLIPRAAATTLCAFIRKA